MDRHIILFWDVTAHAAALWQSVQTRDTKTVRFTYVTAICTRLLRDCNFLIFFVDSINISGCKFKAIMAWNVTNFIDNCLTNVYKSLPQNVSPQTKLFRTSPATANIFQNCIMTCFADLYKCLTGKRFNPNSVSLKQCL